MLYTCSYIKYSFYNWDINIDLNIYLERFVAKVRKVMIVEKKCIRSDKTFDRYCKKWENYLAIYDFRGPDPSIL